MRKIIMTFTALVVIQSGLLAQDRKTLWGEVSLGYGLGLGDYGKNYSLANSATTNMYMASLKAKLGYYVLPQLSLGVGAGLSGYHNPLFNTLPVFAEARYNVKAVPRLFSCLSAGVSLPSLLQGAFGSGTIMEVCAGYSIKLGRRTALNPSVGYNMLLYKQEFVELFSQDVLYSETRHRHTLFLQIGFEF